MFLLDLPLFFSNYLQLNSIIEFLLYTFLQFILLYYNRLASASLLARYQSVFYEHWESVGRWYYYYLFLFRLYRCYCFCVWYLQFDCSRLINSLNHLYGYIGCGWLWIWVYACVWVHVCEREHVRVRERCGAAFVYDDSFTLCGFCDWKLHLIMCTYAFSRKQHATPQEKPTTTLYYPLKWQNTVYTIWIYNAMYYYIIQYLDWLFYTHSTGILNIVIIIK